MEMPFVVELVLGDWSGDGHSESESRKIRSSISAKELKSAFYEGVTKLGGEKFDITLMCEDYEDSSISGEAADAFRTVLGMTFDDTSVGDICICQDEFFAIYMKTCALGNASFEWEEIKADRSNVIDIGGYGLFGS